MSLDRVLEVAESQLGEGEHPPYSNHNKYTVWYGDGDGAWCDMFVSWVADRAGEAKAVGRFDYCPSHVDWFKQHGRWGGTAYRGAVVFFDWNGDGEADHVGYVSEVLGGGSVISVEGNSGSYNGGVVRKVERSPGTILGYGYPAYSSSGPPPFTGRILRLTSPYLSGDDVRLVQEHLTKNGYRLDVDGIYGPVTRAAVVSFQRRVHIAADGEVGPVTWSHLIK